MASGQETPDTDQTSGHWSVSKRVVVSVLILFHLFAVMAAPLGIVEPRSQLFDSIRRAFQPYLHAMFLDHGYRFFAPEPGPSHILKYVITDENGDTISGQFPDRDQIWPRLLYHRWFMLSETMFSHARLMTDEQEFARWKRDMESQIAEIRNAGDRHSAEQMNREFQQQLSEYEQIKFMLEKLSDDVGKVLLKKHNGTTVRMTLVTRLIPTPFQIEDGIKLDDEMFTPEEQVYNLGVVGQGREELEIGPQGPNEAPN